jgi:hypothetical protein
MQNSIATVTRTGFVAWSAALVTAALAGALAIGGLVAGPSGTTWDSPSLVAASAPADGSVDVSNGTAWD